MPSTQASVLSPSPSSATSLAVRCWELASALALAVACLTAIVVPSAHAAKPRAAKVAVTKVTVKSTTTDAKLTVVGHVTLPTNSAREHKRAKVYLTLVSGAGKTEAFTATLTSKGRFTATHTTKLSGALGLDVLVRIAGRQSGKRIVKTVSIVASEKVSTTPTAGTTPTGTPGSPGSPSDPGTPLLGLLKLDPGNQAYSGALSGTYFQMLGITNSNSSALDTNYTLLRPGTDGGLRTDAYQGPPNPPFSGVETGNALASRVVLPQSFLNINFSIVTQPLDPQTGTPDPLPNLVAKDGVITGQITDWAAQWNGLSFNQGSPKPDGTYPVLGPSPFGGLAGTTPVSGTYDAATRHFVITWRSLIVSGPFNDQTGQWHLEGTFVPAS